MAIQLQGSGGVIVGAGEEASKPLHASIHPQEGNGYRISAFTGIIGAALAAGSEVAQFRFVSGTKSFAVVRKVVCDGYAIVTAATAAGPQGFKLVPARAWTVAGSGGTRIVLTGDNAQMETALANSQVSDAGIATTGALTSGTKTKDSTAIGQALYGIGTGALTAYAAFMGSQPLMDANGGGQPLVLANNEGFTIDTTHTGLATLTYTTGFTIEWTEVTAF
jgi:hypothetical protein